MTASTATASLGPTVPASIVVSHRSLPRLFGHQVRYEARALRRNPALIGFTLGMPLVMLVIFSALLGNESIDGFAISYKQWLAPRMAILAVLSSSFVSLATAVALRRGTGELKRVRSTPLPAGIVLAALGLVTAGLSLVSATLVVVGSWWVFGVQPPDVLATGLVLVVACATCSAVGLAVSTFIDRPDNAIAVANGLLWPIVFISGTYTTVPDGSILDRIAGFLPVRHLNDAASIANRNVRGRFGWTDLAVVAAMGVIAAAVAVRRFRWAPASES